MKKLLIAGMIVLATAGSALAQHRHGYRAGHYHGSHHHGISPWVAGAVGLGILGAGIAAGSYYYDRRCWREHVGYDAWGRNVYQTVCNY